MAIDRQKGKKTPHCLSLTQWHMRKCLKWGDGNYSAGAQIAIEEKAEREEAEKRKLGPLLHEPIP